MFSFWRCLSWLTPPPPIEGRWVHVRVDGLSGFEDRRMENRYAVRRQDGERFAVIDDQTGLPAASDGRDLVGLDREDAQDIADVLNRGEQIRRNPLV